MKIKIYLDGANLDEILKYKDDDRIKGKKVFRACKPASPAEQSSNTKQIFQQDFLHPQYVPNTCSYAVLDQHMCK